MSHRFYLFFLGVVFSQSVFAGSAATCAKIFSISPVVIDNFQLEEKMPLTPEIVTKIKSHSIYKFSSSVPNQGRDLIFFLDPLSTVDQKIRPFFKGEMQQSLLIKQYLEFLFPEAVVASQWDFSMSTKKPVKFKVIDTAENLSVQEGAVLDPTIVLDMPLLKRGNPGKTYFQKSNLRKVFGLREDLKVVHLYIKNEDYLKEYGKDIVRHLLKSINIDIFIVSLGNLYRTRSHNIEKSIVDSGTFEDRSFILLSEMKNNENSNLKKRVIINDTLGLMPQLHAVSDLAVVVGAINFIQPLNVGTKTLSLVPLRLLVDTEGNTEQKYDEAALQEIIKTAKLSGGFQSLREINEIPQALEKLRHQSAPLPPAFIKTKNNKSAFDTVLDRIEESLRWQLGF